MARTEDPEEAVLAAAAALAVVSDEHGSCPLALAAKGACVPALRPAFDQLTTALGRCGGCARASGGALISACRMGDEGAVRLLLEQKAPLRHVASLAELGCALSPAQCHAATSALPESAMVAAALGGHDAVVRVLLEAEPGAADLADEQSGVTPLMAAASAGSEACVRVLLRAAAPNAVELCDSSGRNALMLAAAAASGGIDLQILLDAGSDPAARDGRGMSALAHAARGGNLAAIRVLAASVPETLTAADKNGIVPITHAAMEGSQQAVDLLVSYGVSPQGALHQILRGAGPLSAARWLATAASCNSLLWEALRAPSPPLVLKDLIDSMNADDLLSEAQRHVGGRSLLHEVVAHGMIEQATILTDCLPPEVLLATNAQGLTAAGLANELSQEELVIQIEHATLIRLRVILEVIFHPAHNDHAVQVAERMHAFWPSLEVRIRQCNIQEGNRGSHTFDVLWIERCGASRRSSIIHRQAKGASLPSERALWREITRRLHGNVVLQAL
ncbi:MAG: hypothetical protein SGPRY_002453 [Prymnesium sp.]